MSNRKVTGLPLPEVPREAPPEIHGMVDAIETRLGESDNMQAAQALGRAFDFLTRYFCAVAGATSSILELGSESSVGLEFEEARSTLKDRLVLLGDKASDPSSKLIRSVFYVGATRKTPTPRRHSRLLDLGGIPIRGYLNIGDWILLEPETSPELANDSKANRELLRYLPILKEWITATANFFMDTGLSSLRKIDENSFEFDVTLEEQTVTAGPVAASPELMKALASFFDTTSSVAAEESVEATIETSQEVVAAASEAPEPAVEEAGADTSGPPEPVAETDVSEPAAPVVEDEAPEPLATTVEPQPSESASSAPEVTESELPRVQPVVSANTESSDGESDEGGFSDPPRIEVVGVEPSPVGQPPRIAKVVSEEPEEKPEEVTEGDESVEVKGPPSQADSLPRIDGAGPARVDDVSTSVEMPAVEASVELPVSQALRSGTADPDVPDALALPDPTEVVSSPEAPTSKVVPRADMASPEAEEQSAEDAVRLQSEQLSLPEVSQDSSLDDLEPIGEEEESAEAPELDEESLSDPVVAALNPQALRAKPSKSKSSTAPPRDAVLDLFPQVNEPPPEFFDEIDVESDYPEILTTALNDLNGAIESNDSRLICGQMQRCFDILIQFFSGLAASVLCEIDDEALFDFEMEDGRFDLELKIDLMVHTLSCLEEFWENHDSANLIWSVFYDTLLPATDPNCAYLHTRLLGVEGLVPKPFIEFTELCSLVPGEGALSSQQACRKLVHQYLPVLAFWLENAMPLFLESEVDYVDEDDGSALSWAAEVAGVTLDGTGSGFWLEIDANRWNLPNPELAPVFVSGDAPDVLIPVFEQLNNCLEKSELTQAGLYSRIALDFLVQYFAGCSASLWRQQGRMTEQALELFYPDATLEEKERLLVLSLGGISTESEVGQNLGKLFSKGSLQYRVLVQRDERVGIESVAAWAGSREEISEKELLLYLPLLRSWIGAANPWFSAGEQLFEEPTSQGVLEGVVAYGDDFLEMVDPEYVIQLPQELHELVGVEAEAPAIEEPVQADTPFTGKLPQLPVLLQGPPVLVGHVTRLLESADDRRTANAWMGSALEYLIQYYAGLCTSVLGGQSAPIDNQVLKNFNPKASLRQRERLLVTCLEHLKTNASGDVQESIRDVFFKADGSYRSHAKYLGVEGPASFTEEEMLLSYFCRARHHAGHLTTSEMHFGTAVLNSWLDASKAFFASCEHYAEDPGADGQEEIVLELEDDYLDMVLPDYAIQIPARGYYEVLYSESDYEARVDVEVYFPEDARPELLGPQEVVLGGAADDGGEELLGAAMDLGAPVGEDLFAGSASGSSFDADTLFAGTAPTEKLNVDDMFSGAADGDTVDVESLAAETGAPEPEKAEKPEKAPSVYERRRKKKKKSRKQELGSAVLELYKKERLEKARKRAEARARKAEEDPTQVKFNLEYRGLKNSKQLGGRGHFGLIELTNAGGGELKGTIEPAHPCVRVSPTRFEGNQVRVVYQVDPSDMPSSGGSGVTILTQDERVVLRLDALVPTSWWSERTNLQAIGLMLAPSLVYAGFLLMLIGGLLGPSVRESFMQFAHSTQDALPWGSHIKGWIFAMLAILPGTTAIPAAVKWLFAKLDYTVQEETRWWMSATMMTPTLVMLALLYGTELWVFQAPPGRLPLLASRGLLLLLTFGLNLLASSLFSLQTTMWWEDNQDSEAAKKTFLGFWIVTALLGVVITFFMW